MTTDVMASALSGARRILDTEERIWLLGMAHLTGVPDSHVLSDEQIQTVLDVCTHLTDFPAGPVGYTPDAEQRRADDSYRLTTLRSPSAPHLEMRFALGIGGYVGVALTRSGRFENGDVIPSGVLLSDMESVIADTYTLATAAAVQLGYHGAVALGFAVSDDGPGATPTYFCVDEESGALVRCTASGAPLDLVRHQVELDASTTAEVLHQDLYEVARSFAERIGAADAQLVPPVQAAPHLYAGDPMAAARDSI